MYFSDGLYKPCALLMKTHIDTWSCVKEAEDYFKAYVEMLCTEKTRKQFDLEDDDYECVLTDILIYPFTKCDKDIDGYEG